MHVLINNFYLMYKIKGEPVVCYLRLAIRYSNTIAMQNN